MTSGELLDLFRDEMSDTVAPHLWGDELVFGYIDDAQTMFCRLTDGIADARTAAVTQLAIIPGTEWYVTHKSIQLVRAAYRADNGRPVNVLSQEEMAVRGMFFDGRPGPLQALVIGTAEGEVRTYPIPNETVTVQLHVFREPLVRITDDQALEVPDRHHPHLLLWVKHRAYLKQDAECYDRTKAGEFKGAFEAYCAQVKTEQRRARHKPQAVVYGGL